MDMTFELHSGTRMPPFGGSVLEESSALFTEPTSDLVMPDSFIPYPTDSPRSNPGGGYFAPSNEGADFDASQQTQGHFDGGALGLPGFQNVQGNVNVGEGFGFAYPQLGQFIGNQDVRLRGGESFPTHPIGLFGQAGGGQTQDWFSDGRGFGFAQQGAQGQYWTQ